MAGQVMSDNVCKFCGALFAKLVRYQHYGQVCEAMICSRCAEQKGFETDGEQLIETMLGKPISQIIGDANELTTALVGVLTTWHSVPGAGLKSLGFESAAKAIRVLAKHGVVKITSDDMLFEVTAQFIL